MGVKLVLITAFAALATAIPQHAEHISKAQVARSNLIFGGGDLAERTVSDDGTCGAAAGGKTCPGSYCCSSLGWCGNSPLHCGTGCQSAFGNCDSGSSSAPAPAAVASTSSTSAVVVAASTPTPVVVSSNNNGNQAAAELSEPSAGSSSSSSSSSGSSGLGDLYKLYLGDGSVAAGWPAQSSWVGSFETMWAANKGLISAACADFGQANNSDEETQAIHDALVALQSSNGVDSRFALAIMMQESKGCVRAPTTNYGVRNPGLFQSHNGAGTCNDGGVQNPCPTSEIQTMVTDGGVGTGSTPDKGEGLAEILARIGSSDASGYYKTARTYNSGSIDSSGKLELGWATHCYASDIANRLTGWVNAAHGCTLG